MISAGRLWWFIQRDLKRGLAATWNDYVVCPRIAKWNNPYAEDIPQDVSLHVLTGGKDYLLCLWMLASWFHHTAGNWRIVIHDDGTLTEEANRLITRVFPQAEIIPRRSADEIMKEVLSSYPLCANYREKHPLAMKVFDMSHYEKSDRYILLDSDVLFFRRPEFILDWVDGRNAGSWFNRDVAEASTVPPEQAKARLGVLLWPMVNSGLCLIDRTIVDLAFCEQVFAGTDILKGHVWRVEQTLLALCASREGKGGLLLPEYEITLGACRRAESVSRHYVGAVRDQFYAEGIRELGKVLF